MKPNHIYNTRGKKPMKKTKSGMPEPMLAIAHTKVFPEDLKEFNWAGYYIMPKLDGIRAITYEGKLYSRNGKLIPNEYIQAKFDGLVDGLDGELYVHGLPFDEISSMVMSQSNPKGLEIEYHVFDRQVDEHCYNRHRRLSCEEYGLQQYCKVKCIKGVYYVPHYKLESYEDFLLHDTMFIDEGYEGSMLKRTDMVYKNGRSGKKNAELIKVKQVSTSEMVVTGVEPLYRNHNEPLTDEYGRTKRSSSKEFKIADWNYIGKLIGYDYHTKQPVVIGTGFDTRQREQLMLDWTVGSLQNKIVEFKHYPGGKDMYRQPVFLRFRNDMEVE